MTLGGSLAHHFTTESSQFLPVACRPDRGKDNDLDSDSLIVSLRTLHVEWVILHGDGVAQQKW